MRVILINPYTDTSVYGKIINNMPLKDIPLGLLYIAAVLQKNKVDVRLLDADAECVGLIKLSHFIKEHSPDIVGITSSTQGFKSALDTAQMIKRICSAVVVIGGPHVSPIPQEILEKYEAFDIVVRGEGEFSMLEISTGIDWERIAGISFRKNGRIFHNTPRDRNLNLDDLPIPAYDLIDFARYGYIMYKIYIDKLASVITARACPYQCTFCASKVVYGTKVACRSINKVIDEILYLISSKGITGINFVDDTFSLDKKRLLGFCQELKKIRIKWICNVRAGTVDFDTLKIMKDAGCCLINVGVESADQQVLNTIKKGATVEQYRELFKCARKIKLDIGASFIIGMPSDTEETISKTIEFAREMNPTYSNFFNLVPYPGTEIFEYAKRNNLLLFKEWTEIYAPKYEKPTMKHLYLTSEQLMRLKKRAYRRAYLNSRYIFSHAIPSLMDSRKRKFIFLYLNKFIFDFII